MEASAAAYDALYAPVCGDALAALYEGGARVTLEPPREGRCASEEHTHTLSKGNKVHLPL